jgi:uncharacterized protein (UPF0264 family)
VSVRSWAEAKLAVDAGVDLLDVKEPSLGSLGRAEASVWREIAPLAAHLPLSAALGELRDWDDQLAGAIPSDFAFAKLGLAGMADDKAWPARWQRALQRLPASARPVAVVYADQRSAGSPAAAAIVEAADALGCCAVLVDTFVKASRGLLHWWRLDEVAALVDDAQQRGMLAVVAGSLSTCDIARVLPLGPDYVAVRGAACAGGRAAALSLERLLDLVRIVRPGPAVSGREAQEDFS